jgi:hypothetical protein
MRVRIKRLITGSNGTPKAPKRTTHIEKIGEGGNARVNVRGGGREGEHILLNVGFETIDNTHNGVPK